MMTATGPRPFPFPVLSRFYGGEVDETGRPVYNLGQLKRKWVKRLAEEGVPDPIQSVQFITGHVLDRVNYNESEKQVEVERKQQRDLSPDLVDQITDLLKLRLKRVPVQYIVGEWEFRNLTLTLREPVLIPRPETEELVGLVLKYCCPPGHQGDRALLESLSHQKKREEKEKQEEEMEEEEKEEEGDEGSEEVVKLLDVGCGSGAISLSLLQECLSIKGYAVDISEEAVALTTENAVRTGLSERLTVVHNPVESLHLCQIPPFNQGLPWADFIVSNPPYITTDEMAALDPSVAWYEDKRALHGGEDGMAIAVKVLESSIHHLKIGGQVWLELGLNQDPSLLLSSQRPSLSHLSYLSSYKDFTNRTRFHQFLRH